MRGEDWDRRYAASDLLWSVAPNRFVAAELTDLTPGGGAAGRALDLAAGEGRNAMWLAEQGWRVTAVDFSAVALDRGRELAASRGVEVEWVLEDLLAYRPTPEGYGLVLVAYLQIPPEERAKVLRRAAGAVAPGGLALVVGHDLTNLADGVGGPQDPTLLYTPETIAAELPGLTVERAERVRRPIDGEEREAIDALVRATRP